MGLYQVSTRSTWARRLGTRMRGWLVSGRHRVEGYERDLVRTGGVTVRMTRYSLVPTPVRVDLGGPTEVLRRSSVSPDLQSAPVSAPSLPAQHAPRQRVIVYPNAYRAR